MSSNGNRSRCRDTLDVVIRTSGEAAALANSVRAALRAEEPAPPRSRRSQRCRRASTISWRRGGFNCGTLSVFALIALVLASAGIYALMHEAVGRRTRELGIRMAPWRATGGCAAVGTGSGLRSRRRESQLAS
jgi:hypothetical protein